MSGDEAWGFILGTMLSHLSWTLSVNISLMLCGTKDGSGENFVICWETGITIVSWGSKTPFGHFDLHRGANPVTSPATSNNDFPSPLCRLRSITRPSITSSKPVSRIDRNDTTADRTRFSRVLLLLAIEPSCIASSLHALSSSSS